MAQKHLVILIDWFVPGFRAGGPIQTVYNLVLALAEKFQISVITTDRDLGMDQPYESMESDQWIEWEHGVKVFYYSPKKLSRSHLENLLKEIQPDILYINSMFSVPFTQWPLRIKNQYPTWQIVLAPRGMLKPSALRYKWVKKLIYLRVIRLLGWTRGIRWHATNAAEREEIQRYFGGKAKVLISPNLPKQEQAPWQPTPKAPQEVRLIFHARMAPVKNLLFLLRLLPRIKGAWSLDVFGPDEDPAYLHRCQEVISSFTNPQQVQFKGSYQPDQLQKILQAYHFSILPTQGENFGHSIFEAFLAGKPVIISDKTPWRDLTTKEIGWDLPLSKPEAFVQALQEAIDMDEATYQKWSYQAWLFAADFKSDPELLRQTQALFL